VSTLLLSFSGPILMAPAMNSEMWNKPALQRNVAQLRADGVLLIDPEEGYLSCGEIGVGRMASPETIFRAIGEALERGQRADGRGQTAEGGRSGRSEK
ncbi:MAG: flavoprotein, partial [bacterium]